MATQARLFEQEAKIIALVQTVKELRAEARAEGEYMQNSAVYPENYDHWGTIAVNAENLCRQLDYLQADIRGRLAKIKR